MNITQLPEIDDLAQITDHPPAFETPWVVTPELREREGPYADFVAWEGWMSERLSKSPAAALDVWDTLDTLVRIEFWSAMIDSCQFAADKARPAPADLSEAGREGELMQARLEIDEPPEGKGCFAIHYGAME